MTSEPVTLDAETVERIVEMLGAYHVKQHGYLFTQNPIDVLRSLAIAPEKTEAQKLVDAWLSSREPDAGYVHLAQFVLEKLNKPVSINMNFDGCVSREQAKRIARHHSPFLPNAETVTQVQTYATDKWPLGQSYAPTTMQAKRDDAQPQPAPRYVFGPWIEWSGGDCPVPHDWKIETVCSDETMGEHDPEINRAGGYRSVWHKGNLRITHYRVRFEVGEWYDWNGGECPVEAATLVEAWLRHNSDPQHYKWEASGWDWRHLDGSGDIVKFRIVEP